MVTLGQSSGSKEDTEAIMPQEQEPEKRRLQSHSQLYGAITGDSIGNLGDTCPTCWGVGRIPRVMVFFTPHTVEMQIMNVISVTNENFQDIQVLDFDIQVLIAETVVGRIKISNMTAVKSRSEKAYAVVIPITIEDPGLKMTMDVSFQAHSEQLSKDTFEYIDCGANTTIPHHIRQIIFER
ncbi:unnamed protein product [Coregonus sp. 'balchen']|nr:unnamed protein product [Coregonus sp. 'balchen']